MGTANVPADARGATVVPVVPAPTLRRGCAKVCMRNPIPRVPGRRLAGVTIVAGPPAGGLTRASRRGPAIAPAPRVAPAPGPARTERSARPERPGALATRGRPPAALAPTRRPRP